MVGGDNNGGNNVVCLAIKIESQTEPAYLFQLVGALKIRSRGLPLDSFYSCWQGYQATIIPAKEVHIPADHERNSVQHEHHFGQCRRSISVPSMNTVALLSKQCFNLSRSCSRITGSSLNTF